MNRSRILVVDDEPDLLELIRHHPVLEKHEVVCAADGEAALHEARPRLPDLVVLDLMLPSIDGLEVCWRLRSDARTAHISIVMVTAKGEDCDAVSGLAQGADDYVRKPFGMKEFVARVATQTFEAPPAARRSRAGCGAAARRATVPLTALCEAQ